MSMQTMKDYIVPATDEKGQAQYLWLNTNSPEYAEQRVNDWLKGHPGWRVLGKPAVPQRVP
jgi:hypothetical protein